MSCCCRNKGTLLDLDNVFYIRDHPMTINYGMWVNSHLHFDLDCKQIGM